MSELNERINECEEAAKSLDLSLGDQLRRGLEGTHIGIIKLVDGQTLSIEVSDACISRDGKKIADIPNLDVLKSSDAIIKHINDTTKYQVVTLSIF